MNHTASKKIADIASYVILAFAAILVMFPLLFALSLAIQGETVSPSLVPDFSDLDFTVFSRAFAKEPLLLKWILNSFIVASVVTVGQLLVSILAAYPLATFRFPGQRLFFLFFLASFMIPWEATIIPNYITIASLGWKDSYQGLIVPFLASGFGIFLLRQSFMSIPRDLYEASVIEGCSRFRYLWSILLPLSRPTLATLGIYAFLNAWNQYYWPLLVIDNPAWRTTQIGITAFRSSEISVFNMQMAATLIVMLPTIAILYIGQKQLVSGLTAGALKG